MTSGPTSSASRRASGAAARLLVRLRWVVVAGWLAVCAVLSVVPYTSPDDDLGGFVRADNPAIAAEIRSFEIFGFPLLSRTVLVQRDPDGLSVYAQAEAVLRGIAVNQRAYDSELILGALPVPNTLGLFPGAAERGTTVLTYLFLPPRAGFAEQRDAAESFADAHLGAADDAFVGVTGSIPARAAQAEVLEESLPYVEVATVAVIALIVALCFRSLVAPLVTLFVALVAAVVALRGTGLVAALLELSVPTEIRPLLIALLLGVVTDYTVFFLSALRAALAAGLPDREAVVRATATTAPVVAVAGLTVAAGTGALLVADSALFRGLGPALASTVLVGLAVAVTLAPAVLAVLGRSALWPEARAGSAGPAAPAAAPTAPPAAPQGVIARLAHALTHRRPAAAVLAVTTALLVLAALPLLHLRLGVAFVESLPSGSPVVAAAQAARSGFAPGILAPTEVLLEGSGVARQARELDRLSDLLREQPGVDAVVGPGLLPVADRYGVFLARSGDAARLLVVLAERPLGALGVTAVDGLRERLPELLQASGLGGVRASLAGDSALSALIVEETTDDLLRISTAALLANLVLLVLFLRAPLTALLLLGASVLALAAALGLTVLVFQDVLGGSGLTFYVPFAAAVLLVSLGSDYNIYAVGRVWEELRTRPLAEAVRVAFPETTTAIVAAAATLAASFGLLALVPLRPFRELAFAMAVGILLDAAVVRTLVVPSLLTLLGRHARPLHLSSLRTTARPVTAPAPGGRSRHRQASARRATSGAGTPWS